MIKHEIVIFCIVDKQVLILLEDLFQDFLYMKLYVKLWVTNMLDIL